MICESCGGVVGRDCFNPSECMWIYQQMMAQQAAERAVEMLTHREASQQSLREHHEHLQEQWERHMVEDVGFDPVSMGM